MSAIDRFKELLDERGWTYATVYRASGLQVDQQVELQAFGQRMVVTKANPINDQTHTRLVAHIMCPLPEQLMMMLDRMCGRTESRKAPDARIYAPLCYPDNDLAMLRGWEHWSKTFHCGHVIDGDGPNGMRKPEVCPICGSAGEGE